MSHNDKGLPPPSHAFPVTTEDGYTVDLGQLANEVLTTRRNQMQDAEHESPMNPGTIARAGFEAGVYAAVSSICGKSVVKAFRTHCDEMWRNGSGYKPPRGWGIERLGRERLSQPHRSYCG